MSTLLFAAIVKGLADAMPGIVTDETGHISQDDADHIVEVAMEAIGPWIDPNSDGAGCHHCGEVGHLDTACPTLKSETPVVERGSRFMGTGYGPMRIGFSRAEVDCMTGAECWAWIQFNDSNASLEGDDPELITNELRDFVYEVSNENLCPNLSCKCELSFAEDNEHGGRFATCETGAVYDIDRNQIDSVHPDSGQASHPVDYPAALSMANENLQQDLTLHIVDCIVAFTAEWQLDFEQTAALVSDLQGSLQRFDCAAPVVLAARE